MDALPDLGGPVAGAADGFSAAEAALAAVPAVGAHGLPEYGVLAGHTGQGPRGWGDI